MSTNTINKIVDPICPPDPQQPPLAPPNTPTAPPTAAEAAGQQGVDYTGPNITVPLQDFVTPAANALTAAMQHCVDQIYAIEKAAQPAPPNGVAKFFGGLFNILKQIPVVGAVADLTQGFVRSIYNIVHKGQSVMTADFSIGYNHYSDQAKQIIAIYNDLKAKYLELQQQVANAGGKEAFNQSAQRDRQTSVDHRMQLMRQGFYSQSQIDNGLSHRVGGGSLENAHRLRERF